MLQRQSVFSQRNGFSARRNFFDEGNRLIRHTRSILFYLFPQEIALNAEGHKDEMQTVDGKIIKIGCLGN
jgi:hypothetical protein